MIVNRTEEEKSKEYDFSGDDRKKEAYWKRDKNLRGVLMHLYEWHQLLLNWLKNRFEISAQSFYQVNPVQTKNLYEKAISLAGLTGNERVMDAYCGIGTIGLIASRDAREVISVELNPDAVRDAVTNAKRNQIKNVSFYQNDAGAFMVSMAEKGEKADVVFMDPPRAGSDEAFLSSVVTLSPKKVVYVSCNPETLARDLRYLTKHGYKAEEAWGYDMFAWSEHVETVCLLTQKKA